MAVADFKLMKWTIRGKILAFKLTGKFLDAFMTLECISWY